MKFQSLFRTSVVLSEALDESKLDLVEVFLSLAGGPANVSTYESVLLAAANKRDLVFAERRGYMESCNQKFVRRTSSHGDENLPYRSAHFITVGMHGWATVPNYARIGMFFFLCCKLMRKCLYAKRKAFETNRTNIGRTTLYF